MSWPKGKSRGPQTSEHIARRFAAGAGAQKGVKQSPEHIEKCRQTRIGKKINVNRSDQVRKSWADGVYDDLFRRQAKFIYADGTPMRSNWERLAAAYFDKIGLEWQYEPQRFVLPTRQHYYPDFYLPRLDLWVEVKGYSTFNAITKFDLFTGMGYNAVLVTGQTEAEFLEVLRDAVMQTTETAL